MDRALAAALARQAVDNLAREYPNAPALLLRSGDDLVAPRVVHPAFFGSFDWHSSVHQHWLLVRLLRLDLLDAAGVVAAHAALDRSLTAANLAVEASYLQERPGFERPYGWAWALALATELDRLAGDRPDHGPEVWRSAMRPLVEVIRDTWLAFLPRARYPIRAGTHPNSAFAMTLGLEYARSSGDVAFGDALVEWARSWFLDDRDYPAWLEPDGEDFLSGALSEAALMARCLPDEAFAAWFSAFLPATPPTLLHPVEVADRSDGKTVHLEGLNLSRAWSWRSIAAALRTTSARGVEAEAAATRHLEAALPHVVDGDYVGTHWLGTFAVLALT